MASPQPLSQQSILSAMLFDLFLKMLSESCVTDYRLWSDKEFQDPLELCCRRNGICRFFATLSPRSIQAVALKTVRDSALLEREVLLTRPRQCYESRFIKMAAAAY